MKIAIASGKGGVGKSMLSSVLSFLFHKSGKKVIACDCDVDAPNLAIWLGKKGKLKKLKEFSTLKKPKIDLKKCIGCGKCEEVCVFNAIEVKNQKSKLNYYLCEGCGACQIICPQHAIRLIPINNGKIFKTKTKYGFPVISGQLQIGESNSGKVVVETKAEAEKLPHEIMIMDSAPGTGCPVIASLSDVDFVILVTEPTPSALSDLEKVLKVVEYFNKEFALVINKWQLNPKFSKKIENRFRGKILGKISFDKEIYRSIANFKPIIETNLKAKKEIEAIYKKLINLIK
jgi:MinD superfamily P-loop ATPase